MAVVGVERRSVRVVVVDDGQADLALERSPDVEPAPCDVPEVGGALRRDHALSRRRAGRVQPDRTHRPPVDAGLLEDVVEAPRPWRVRRRSGPSRTALGVSTRVSTRNLPVLSSTVALFVVPPLSRPTTTHGASACMSASLGRPDPRSRRNPVRPGRRDPSRRAGRGGGRHPVARDAHARGRAVVGLVVLPHQVDGVGRQSQAVVTVRQSAAGARGPVPPGWRRRGRTSRP